jgi:hypothetical protein
VTEEHPNTSEGQTVRRDDQLDRWCSIRQTVAREWVIQSGGTRFGQDGLVVADLPGAVGAHQTASDGLAEAEGPRRDLPAELRSPAAGQSRRLVSGRRTRPTLNPGSRSDAARVPTTSGTRRKRCVSVRPYGQSGRSVIPQREICIGDHRYIGHPRYRFPSPSSARRATAGRAAAALAASLGFGQL